MNWKRGFLRTWIVLSAIWMLAVGTFTTIEWRDVVWSKGDQAIASSERAANLARDPENPFAKFAQKGSASCPEPSGFDPCKPYTVIYDPDPFGDNASRKLDLRWLAGAAIGLPAAVFLAGMSVRWILIGFQS